MKILLLLMIASMSMAFTFSNTKEEPKNEVVLVGGEYQQGWKDGYCEGWKDVKGQYSICPIVPICPIPKIECNEGYRCGYNRGFKAGRRKALSSK